MAGPKYQNVPQRDSLDQPSYSQAPPSYEAEASTQDALLGGAPRSLYVRSIAHTFSSSLTIRLQ